MQDWNALALLFLLKALIKAYQGTEDETTSDIHP